jgi:hypothetical protein
LSFCPTFTNKKDNINLTPHLWSVEWLFCSSQI